MAGEKYWKISRVVMVIMSEYIGFITSGHKATSDKSNIFTIYGKIIGNYTQDSKGITDLHASGGYCTESRVASGGSDERQCNTTSTRM